MKFEIRRDGKLDIFGKKISIVGIVPYVDGMPITTNTIEKKDSEICWHTAGGSVSMSIETADGDLILSAKIDGFDGVHDVEPIGEAVVSGASNAYFQGFGMEGPSGYQPIDNEEHYSHGIIGLDGGEESLVLYATDHSQFLVKFLVKKSSKVFGDKTVLSVGVNLEGTTSGEVFLPQICIKASDSLMSGFSEAAKEIAKKMQARTPKVPAYHWCSWYYYYETMDQKTLEKLLADNATREADFRYIQLDAGYTDHLGDWLIFNHRYPEGLQKAAQDILSAGYDAGIWIAPFLVGDLSTLFKEHPDWIIRQKDGQPYVVFKSYTEPKIWGSRDCDYYILDATNPEAFDYLREVFETYYHYGFTLFKTDFLLWGMVDSAEVKRYDGSLTSVEIIRRVMAMIREIIGEDGYILGSIAPFMPLVGCVDGMRIAGDIGAQWSDKYGPVNLLQELPYDNYFNNIFWQNDPDSIILREQGTHLTEEETYGLALLQTLSGGVLTTSDPVGEIAKERRELLSFLRPRNLAFANFPYLESSREELVLTHRLDDWNLLFIMNPTEHSLQVAYSLSELFGDQCWYQYRYNRFDENEVVCEQKDLLVDTIAAHDYRLVFVSEEPLVEKPSNLWGR